MKMPAGITSRLLQRCSAASTAIMIAVIINANAHAACSRRKSPEVMRMSAAPRIAAIQTAFIAVLKGRGIDGAARSPWYFPTAEGYLAKLEAHAFHVETIRIIPRPTPLPTDMRGWLE